MDQKGKNITLLLIVVLILTLALAGAGFYLLQKEQAKSRSLGAAVEELTVKQKIAEEKLQKAQNAIDLMKVELKQKDDNIANLTSELKKEKSAREDAFVRLDRIKSDLEQQKAMRTDLEKKFGGAQDELKKAQAQLKELQAQKQDAEAKLKELEAKAQGVDLGTIAVTPQDGASAPVASQPSVASAAVPASAANAKVLVVNKEYNFAVINVGSKDGVVVGQVFSFYRNNQYLGDGKVEKVHDSMAALGFSAQDLKDKLNEGDKAVAKQG